MKMTKAHKRELIAALLPMLKQDVMEPTTKMERVIGSTVILRGGVAMDGKTIDPHGMYMLEVPTTEKVNHTQRIHEIIRQSRDLNQLTDRLGAYQRKYGIAPPSAFLASPLNKNNNEQ